MIIGSGIKKIAHIILNSPVFSENLEKRKSHSVGQPILCFFPVDIQGGSEEEMFILSVWCRKYCTAAVRLASSSREFACPNLRSTSKSSSSLAYIKIFSRSSTRGRWSLRRTLGLNSKSSCLSIPALNFNLAVVLFSSLSERVSSKKESSHVAALINFSVAYS